jgi:hypothetical protein
VPKRSAPHSPAASFVLQEIETARYVLTQHGQDWQQEFTTVAAAYFYARSLTEDGEGRLIVVNERGEQGTLFLF